MNYAPIALFVYNRPLHTRQTVEALLANAESAQSQCYIFSDAPKHATDDKAVSEVRQYIKSIGGFSSVRIIERKENYGLAKSIIDGVTKVCQEHGSVIVLEDDLVVSRFFLKFMNDALAFYEHDERVCSIGGYLYPVKTVLPETFFLKGADCWGWATWRRGWDLFEKDGRVLLKELMRLKLTYSFDFDGAYPHTKMLISQIKKKNNSWAIRWGASLFLKDRLMLYPGRSLVHNIGNDGSGTHCATTDVFASTVLDVPVSVGQIAVEENLFARQQVVKFLRDSRSLSKMPKRIILKLIDMANQTINKYQRLRVLR